MFVGWRRDRASSRINPRLSILRKDKRFAYRERDEMLDSDAKMGGGRLIERCWVDFEHRRLVDLLFYEMKTVKRRR